MAVFKCKICGGSLSINENDRIATCDYCGTKQTLPRLDDEKRIQLYDRANYFRRENEFDKAMGIYEMILSEDKEDYEAYWGIVLCRYGIQYVKDPRTSQRIPTINRSQFTSIFEDDDYLNAIRYSDEFQREIFKKEATIIDKIQKRILEISSKEEPFDIFICYKETDKNGNRTKDSVYAQDIYTTLTKEGYKVFFSRITLEDKLGSAYEPYIFAALNSAKVMLVVGTEKEHFNAVWVKNEWSRYLSLIKTGKDKTLIPIYNNITPYDMPEEFQYIQSQDMSKIGFMQDLIYGIKKIVDKKTTIVKETTVVNDSNANIGVLLERAFMFIKDGNWKSANEYCEKVLDIDPKNEDAYIGKLMIESKVRKKEDLANRKKSLKKSKNYSKVLDFADEKTLEELNSYEMTIKGRKKKRKIIASSILSFIAVALAFSLLLVTVIIPKAKFSDIVAISASEYSTIGLKSDGTVVAVGDNGAGQCDVSNWTDIVAISAGRGHTIGLKSDGTVVAVGRNGAGQCDVSDWSGIVAVSAGDSHTVGLKSDGTVVAVGYNVIGQCDVDNWTDIVAISSGYYHTVGLKSDGTVVAAGEKYNMSNWTDIVAISTEYNHNVGLKSNGTVVDDKYDVSNWKDIVSISAGYNHTVGLKSDGTVVAVGDNSSGQCDVSNWTDIVAISAGRGHTIGLKSDGTVVAVGYNGFGQCLVGGKK